jgi:hypothetical protein
MRQLLLAWIEKGNGSKEKHQVLLTLCEVLGFDEEEKRRAASSPRWRAREQPLLLALQ